MPTSAEWLDYARQFLPPLILSILTFFAGHFLALGRDRRKEFNAVADPIAIQLEDQANDPKLDVEINFDLIRRHFSGWRSDAFDKAVNNYYRSIGYENTKEYREDCIGIKDSEWTRRAARSLLSWLRHR